MRLHLTLSEPLAKAAKRRRKDLKYRTDSEYIAGLVRYDCQTQKEHHISQEFAALDGWERDRLDAAILRQVESGVGIHGSWIEARIDASVKKHLDAGHVPTPKQVASDIARDIADGVAAGAPK